MLVLVRWSPPESKGLMQRRKLCTEDAKESKCHGIEKRWTILDEPNGSHYRGLQKPFKYNKTGYKEIIHVFLSGEKKNEIVWIILQEHLTQTRKWERFGNIGM